MPDPALPLAGQVALITGACGGIGRACAIALARAGADIAANDVGVLTSESPARPQTTAECSPNDGGLTAAARTLVADIAALGRKPHLLPADVSDQNAVEAMVVSTVRNLGRLDVFVS